MGGTVLWGRRRLGVARVHGRSMEPTLRSGDRLLVLHGGRPRPRRLVVVRLPDGTVAVKRVLRREPGGWWVERDNPTEGVDSWSVGAIPDDDVVARVLLRLPGRGSGRGSGHGSGGPGSADPAVGD